MSNYIRKQITDLFNIPIDIGSYVLTTLNGNFEICTVAKFGPYRHQTTNITSRLTLSSRNFLGFTRSSHSVIVIPDAQMTFYILRTGVNYIKTSTSKCKSLTDLLGTPIKVGSYVAGVNLTYEKPAIYKVIDIQREEKTDGHLLSLKNLINMEITWAGPKRIVALSEQQVTDEIANAGINI